MAVNGIEIRVGQVWRTQNTRLVTILGVGKDRDPVFPVSGRVEDYGVIAKWDLWGRFISDKFDSPWDLVELISEPDDHESLTFHPLPTAEPEQSNEVTSAQKNDGQPLPFDDIVPMGIGDVHSDAKGSGARYNNGKAPLELIPLSIMVPFFTNENATEGAQDRALRALDALGMFQARAGNVYEVLRELGDHWEGCAQVFDYGRLKYAEWNWAKGMPWSVPIACAARHLLAIIRGETHDPESGKPHEWHVYCNVVMLLTYQATYTEGDDRPAKGLLL